MNLFSISEIARFSGLKPHTIRIWEKRYNALNPGRSTGNTRYYDNSQLRRLLNIVSLTECGYKLPDICAMTDKKLFSVINEINETTSQNESTNYFIHQLIEAGMSFSEQHFEKIFSHCLIRFGIKNAYIQVIYPMLSRIGVLWSIDDIAPANEHFISNLLRQKLFTAINSLPPPTLADTWLLFLPEDEFHEIGLLLANYLIRLSGKKVIYLGSNVPLQSIAVVTEQTKPDNLLLFVVRHDLPAHLKKYCNKLVKTFTGQAIYVAGNEKLIAHLKPYKKIKLLTDIKSLEEKLSFV